MANNSINNKLWVSSWKRFLVETNYSLWIVHIATEKCCISIVTICFVIVCRAIFDVFYCSFSFLVCVCVFIELVIKLWSSILTMDNLYFIIFCKTCYHLKYTNEILRVHLANKIKITLLEIGLVKNKKTHEKN